MATINGSIPQPTLRWREGDTVTIRVANKLRESTSIHWHGIILPYQMDGVPGISFAGIPPGETFTYRFKVEQSGTYWYHSHSGFQELTGMYGAIIVEPAGGDPVRADRDHVVLLSDWTDEDPMRVFSKLKVQGDYYNYNRPTALDFFRDVSRDGLKSALDKRKMWNEMRMNPTDLADLSANTLPFLLNWTTPAGNWTGLFRPDERVRFRFINGAGNSFYDVRIPGLTLKVVQVDAVNVEPVPVDEFRFGPGETCDVLVEPKGDAYTIFAQSMDRTGYARGTLATAPAGSPGACAGKARMADDGRRDGFHGNGRHGRLHGRHESGRIGSHGAARRHARDEPWRHGDARHGDRQLPRSARQPGPPRPHRIRARHGPARRHGANQPDDPGIGLRNNGRRVLTLADLHTLGGPLDPRGAEREIELHLTGNMERYTWSFDGLEFGQSTPVHFRYGERVRVILHNDTMMTHPMHLHGMWSELENPDGRFLARRHTLPVQPAQRISFLVTADALGRCAWHCHLMLHMEAGMFRVVVVA